MSKRMGSENKLLKKINNNIILNQTLINHTESKINNINLKQKIIWLVILKLLNMKKE